VWRRVAVNHPPYGCAKAEGKSAFCFLKTYFGSGLAHQAGKKVDDEIDNAKFEREFKRVVSMSLSKSPSFFLSIRLQTSSVNC
jgi:hypothetical protein